MKIDTSPCVLRLRRKGTRAHENGLMRLVLLMRNVDFSCDLQTLHEITALFAWEMSSLDFYRAATDNAWLEKAPSIARVSRNSYHMI